MTTSKKLPPITDSPKRRPESEFKEAKKQAKRFGVSIFMGIVVNVIAALLIANFTFIVSTIPIWVSVIIIAIFGIGFYWFRSRFRLAYGIFEVIFGYWWTINILRDNSFDFSKISILPVIAGIYIMVRGFDNIDHGLGGEPKKRWNKWFKPKDQDAKP